MFKKLKKKFIIITISIICFLFFFCSCNYCYADNEVSNSSDYIDTSVYHTFINYLVSHDGDKYSQYINNMHCTILKVSLNDDYYGKFTTRGGYASYLNINSYDEQAKYNQNTNNNTVQYLTYIALFSDKPLIYSEVNNDITYNGHTFHITENLSLPENGDLYFIMGMSNTLGITIYPFNFNKNFSLTGFNYNSGTHLVYTDDTIYYNNSNSIYANSVISNLELFDFEITENETGSGLYQKVMALYNNEFNTYANLWALGDKPTVAIYDNSNVNCVIPLLGNNYVANQYIAIFSTCRLCEYNQNNNSRHFNTLTYGDEVLHILIFDEGTNNYNFYNLMSRNYQNDVIFLTGTSGDELLFCNSNIVQKSDANNFIVSSNNQLTYYYYSDMELLETYPINENNNTWQQISDSINNSASTFTGFMGDMFNEIYDITSEFITDTAVPFFKDSMDRIAEILPFHVILDFINYIKNFVNDAEQVRDTIVANNGYDFTFTLLNKNFTFNPFFYLFTTNLYKYAKLFCNLSFFCFLVLRIYKDIIFILCNESVDIDDLK